MFSTWNGYGPDARMAVVIGSRDSRTGKLVSLTLTPTEASALAVELAERVAEIDAMINRQSA